MKCPDCGFPIIQDGCPCKIGGLVDALQAAGVSENKQWALYVSIVISLSSGSLVSTVTNTRGDGLEVIRNFADDDPKEASVGMLRRLFDWQEHVTSLVTDGFVVSVEDLHVDIRKYPYWSHYRMLLNIVEPVEGQALEDRVLFSTDVIMMSLKALRR